MHLVEQRRNFLDLIDHDLPVRVERLSLDLLAQQFGTATVAPKFLGLQQIDPERVWIRGSQQRAFAGLAWTPQEKRLGSRVRQREIPLKHKI